MPIFEDDKSSPLNHKAMGWLNEYKDNFGWRSTEIDIRNFKKRIQIEKNYDINFPSHSELLPVEINGDVVVFMRCGERDARNLMEWCKNRYERTQPERDRLRELERTKLQRQRENHQLFREFVRYFISFFFFLNLNAHYIIYYSIFIFCLSLYLIISFYLYLNLLS